jgi:hypothetical protein
MYQVLTDKARGVENKRRLSIALEVGRTTLTKTRLVSSLLNRESGQRVEETAGSEERRERHYPERVCAYT